MWLWICTCPLKYTLMPLFGSFLFCGLALRLWFTSEGLSLCHHSKLQKQIPTSLILTFSFCSFFFLYVHTCPFLVFSCPYTHTNSWNPSTLLHFVTSVCLFLSTSITAPKITFFSLTPPTPFSPYTRTVNTINNKCDNRNHCFLYLYHWHARVKMDMNWGSWFHRHFLSLYH